jgi:uncharacterized protein with HEPN domain
VPRKAEKEVPALLWDMLDAAQAVEDFLRDKTYYEYCTTRLLRNGVERNVEIIGEAASKVPKAYQDAHPEIPWRKIIAQRHVLVHEYGEIEDEMLWKVATISVPELIRSLEPLIPALPPEESLGKER